MIRKNNKRLYESIIRDVAKTVKKHLNEDNNKQAYIIYDKIDNIKNIKNLSNKQSVLFKYLMSSSFKGDVQRIILVRGKNSLTQDLLKIKNHSINLPSAKDLIKTNEIGLFVIYDNLKWLFINTSLINKQSEQQTFIYSYHDDDEQDINSLIITTDDNFNFTNSETYEDELIH